MLFQGGWNAASESGNADEGQQIDEWKPLPNRRTGSGILPDHLRADNSWGTKNSGSGANEWTENSGSGGKGWGASSKSAASQKDTNSSRVAASKNQATGANDGWGIQQNSGGHLLLLLVSILQSYTVYIRILELTPLAQLIVKSVRPRQQLQGIRPPLACEAKLFKDLKKSARQFAARFLVGTFLQSSHEFSFLNIQRCPRPSTCSLGCSAAFQMEILGVCRAVSNLPGYVYHMHPKTLQ